MFSLRVQQNIVLGLLAVLFIAGIFLAYVSGSRAAKSAIILHNVQQFRQGFHYFFVDQNRYPSELEVADRNIMLNYFSPYPPLSLSGGRCQQTYHYSNPSSISYELDFCLPKASGGWPAGFNKITQ